jgi:predicted acylesterase/phospholipase RssA
VATVAVVPLTTSPTVGRAIDAVVEALSERRPGLAVVDASAADTVDCDQLEGRHGFVVFLADAEPTPWTAQCLRHADHVLLVADATDRPTPRPVERLVGERRRTVPARSDLVLVHPPTTADPSGTRRWLGRGTIDGHHHLRDGSAEHAARVARHVLDRPVVLVLSGGGARGMAEIGVIRALADLGIPVDAAGGTSAGALVAGCLARGWGPDRMERTFRAALVGFKPLDLTLPAVALTTGRRVTERLRAAAADLDIEDLWLPFYCVSTNLSRNVGQVHESGPAWRAIRASFAIPGVFPPLPEGGDVLVDGGLVDNLPVARARARHGGATVVAVDVGTRRDLPAGALSDSGVVAGWSVLWDRLHPLRRRREQVNIVRVMTRLTELGAEQGADRGDVLVRPEVQDFPILDFDRFDDLIARGREAGRATLEPWLATRAAPF